MNLQKAFLTLFGAGLSPVAPGTVGTVFAMPIGLLVILYMGTNTLTTLVIVTSIIAIFEINKYEANGGEHDDKTIVIDEAVGVWLTLAITFGALQQSWQNIYNVEIGILLSFLSFRLFDIWKPSTIGYIDRKVAGGLGVVGDDLLAGFAGGVLNLLIFRILSYFGV